MADRATVEALDYAETQETADLYIQILAMIFKQYPQFTGENK